MGEPDPRTEVDGPGKIRVVEDDDRRLAAERVTRFIVPTAFRVMIFPTAVDPLHRLLAATARGLGH